MITSQTYNEDEYKMVSLLSDNFYSITKYVFLNNHFVLFKYIILYGRCFELTGDVHYFFNAIYKEKRMYYLYDLNSLLRKWRSENHPLYNLLLDKDIYCEKVNKHPYHKDVFDVEIESGVNLKAFVEKVKECLENTVEYYE